MGLDMYAMTTTEAPASEVDFKPSGQVAELHRWRKHPDLHGWIHRLYKEKGGDAPAFNCIPLVLTAADLDRLEQAICQDSLPPTGGFFFGRSDGTEKADDLAFIRKARQAIEAGLTVYYDSWR